MTKIKTMKIAFANGGILPTSVTGSAERRIAAHQAVDVPVQYGQHLVDDRFAYIVKKQSGAGRARPTGDLTDAENLIASLREDLAKASEDAEKQQLQERISAAEASIKSQS